MEQAITERITIKIRKDSYDRLHRARVNFTKTEHCKKVVSFVEFMDLVSRMVEEVIEP